LPALLSLPLAIPPLVITLALNFSTVKVHGESMQPALRTGDVLLVDHTARPRGPFGIYVIEVEGQQSPLIKRLLGMPGQSMEIRYDRLFADGQEVHPRTGTPPDIWNEERPAAARRYGKTALELATDEMFFLGDNPPASRDSRDFGPVKAEAVRGRVVWSLRGSQGFAPIKTP
jgi:signal peptidase I